MNATQPIKNILVTGGAGFIGSHLTERLLAAGCSVTVLDNFNSYYDPTVKHENARAYSANPSVRVVEGDIRNDEDLERVFAGPRFDAIVHLAAMAGVRPSLEKPAYYMDVNVLGTQRLLDRATGSASRPGNSSSSIDAPHDDSSHSAHKLPLFIFGSSSSVYGERSTESFKETDLTDRPVSPYAASKVAGEMICHSAHKSAGLNVVCLRFFTVFGPRQRPDLAIHKFLKLMEAGQPIEVYGEGTTRRDYTFVCDIVDGIMAALELDEPGFEIINLGRGNPIQLSEMIEALEKVLGKSAIIDRKPLQKGDVTNTFANIDKARKLLGYEPKTSFEEGIRQFLAWNKSRPGINQEPEHRWKQRALHEST